MCESESGGLCPSSFLNYFSRTNTAGDNCELSPKRVCTVDDAGSPSLLFVVHVCKIKFCILNCSFCTVMTTSQKMLGRTLKMEDVEARLKTYLWHSQLNFNSVLTTHIHWLGHVKVCCVHT